ncbi:tryptophan-rich sensory protein [Candidatus Parcubacteria bacterium]|nr:tryptophan-rich sensory protein [Patescibacteria group bacterium]MBU4466927.1 tryptophan-rich sensory protein [Patescibacteria group bacterium]MCG2688100.1 tryptophan-rich sensory protein [Candidatus Parcubacteria bacterium]
MKQNNLLKLIGAIIGCQLAGLVGSIFTAPAINTWYSQINKPSFNPPNWIFAPVWTILFLLMGISFYLVWNKGLEDNKAKTAVLIFKVQLGLNILWSMLFFGLRQPLLAFIEIIILWGFILMTIIRFYKISRVAAYLLLPYLLWVGFASFLNYSILILN